MSWRRYAFSWYAFGLMSKGNGVAEVEGTSSEKVMTVTFRIPTRLKRELERAASDRGMTTTRLVVEAIMDAVNDKPPRWWQNWQRSAAKPKK